MEDFLKYFLTDFYDRFLWQNFLKDFLTDFFWEIFVTDFLTDFLDRFFERFLDRFFDRSFGGQFFQLGPLAEHCGLRNLGMSPPPVVPASIWRRLNYACFNVATWKRSCQSRVRLLPIMPIYLPLYNRDFPRLFAMANFQLQSNISWNQGFFMGVSQCAFGESKCSLLALCQQPREAVQYLTL